MPNTVHRNWHEPHFSAIVERHIRRHGSQPAPQTFGDYLERAIKRARMTPMQVATAIGHESSTSVYRWMRNTTYPKRETAMLLADAIGMSRQEMVNAWQQFREGDDT